MRSETHLCGNVLAEAFHVDSAGYLHVLNSAS